MEMFSAGMEAAEAGLSEYAGLLPVREVFVREGYISLSTKDVMYMIEKLLSGPIV